MNKDASQKRKESRTLEVQASDIKGILREQRKSTKILSDIKELLKPDTTVKIGDQKTIAEKRNELKQTPALLKAPVTKEYAEEDDQKESSQNNINVDTQVPEKPKGQTKKTTPTPSGKVSTGARGVGALGAVGAVAGVGAVLGGLVGLGFDKRSQLPETEQEAAERGVSLSKENQIFSEKPKGLAQVLDEQEAERKKKQKEAAEIGPSRVIREDYQAAQNQAADYKAAGDTMAAAGYTTVTGRGAFKPGAKEMQPADFEQAQQAQAAREAVGRGLRQRKGKEDTETKPEQNKPSILGKEDTETKPEQNKPSIFSRIGSRVTNLKNEIEFAYNRGLTETPGDQEVDRRMEEIISAREKEGNPLERFSQEYKDIERKLRKEIESKNPKAFVLPEQKIGSQTEIKTSSSNSGDGYSHLQTHDNAITSSKSLFGSELLGGLATKKGLSKEFSIGSSHVSRDQNGEKSEEFSDVKASRVSGGFFGRDKYQVTLDGEDVDVDKQYYSQIKSLLDAGKPKDAAALARHIRDQQSPISLKSPEETVTAMSVGASSLPSALNQLSTENRELNREAPAGQVQPVVIQNNNNMASQNFVPIQAQPRVPSSFSRLQDRSATY